MLCAFAGVLSAGTVTLTFPANQYGIGNFYVDTYPESGFGQWHCWNGWGDGASGVNASNNGCTIGLGDASGTALSYMDANGIHGYGQAVTSGIGTTVVETGGYFFDTITNNSGVNATFQLGFHVDGQFNDTAGASSQLMIQFSRNIGGAPVGDGISTFPNEWLFNQNGAGALSIDQDLLTTNIALAPGESYTYILYMDTYTTADWKPSDSYSGVTGTSDVSNTLTVTKFSARDSGGNPLPGTDFGSADGLNYNSIASLPSPEPGSTWLLAGILSAWAIRRRRN